MKIFLYILSIVLVITGTIFFLQGINIIPGSFMTGRPEWAIYGGISILAGVILAIGARKRS